MMDFKFNHIIASLSECHQALDELRRAVGQTTFTPEQKGQVCLMLDQAIAKLIGVKYENTLLGNRSR